MMLGRYLAFLCVVSCAGLVVSASSFGERGLVVPDTLAPESVAAADFNGDGCLDLASTSYSDDKLSVFLSVDVSCVLGSQRVVSTAASSPRRVVAADINGDGHPDLVCASSDDDTISVFFNLDGTGQFGPQHVVTSDADEAVDVAASDLNGDGHVDLVSATQGDDAITVYFNLHGTGEFGPPHVVTTDLEKVMRVITADLNGDGHPDLVSASQGDDKVAVYMNIAGTGKFGPQRVVTTTAKGACGVAVADLDGEGHSDIVSASYDDGKIAVFFNIDGTGDFGPEHVVTTDAEGVLTVTAADFDGDGHVDLASGSDGCGVSCVGAIAVYLNPDGTGKFAPPVIITTLVAGASGLTAADLDRDSHVDLASASWRDNKVAVYLNIGGISKFAPQHVLSGTVSAPSSVCVADLNGDGHLDLASTSFGDDRLAVYLSIDGTGQFQPQRIVDADVTAALSVDAADVNGDGHIDLAIASQKLNMIAVYYSIDGTGTYGPRHIVSTDAVYASIVITADVNGDGYTDLVSGGVDRISVHINTDGRGTFAAPHVVSKDVHSVSDLALADLDGDGHVDLVSASLLGDTHISVYFNKNGTGCFGPGVVVTDQVKWPASVVAADLNNDGFIDLASSSLMDSKIAVYFSIDGSGSFGPQVLVTDDTFYPRTLDAADIDGDGNIDLAFGCDHDHVLAVLYNTEGTGMFAPVQDVSTQHEGVSKLVARDINNDGLVDLTTASFDSNSIAVYLQSP